MKRTVLALLFCSSLLACAAEDDLGGDLGESQLAATGGTAQMAPGYVSYVVNGQGPQRSGVLVSPRHVLTSSRFMPALQTPPSTVLFTHHNRVNGNNVLDSVRGKYINYNPNVALAIVELERDFSNSPPLPTLSTLPTSQLGGIDVVCRAFDAQDRAELTHITTISTNDTVRMGWDATLDPFSPDAMEDKNSGAACVRIDANNVESVVAIAECVENTSTQAVDCRANSLGSLVAVSTLAEWIDDMKWLTQVRSRAQGAYAVHSQPTPSYIWDIQWGGLGNHYRLQQYPIHGGANQWFWVDYNGHPTHARLVSAQSGRCIDVPGASTVPGKEMQQYKCHRKPADQERNQRFDIPALTGNQWTGTIRPLFSNEICLGVKNGPVNGPALIETQLCSGASRQQFSFANGLPVDFPPDEVEPVRP